MATSCACVGVVRRGGGQTPTPKGERGGRSRSIKLYTKTQQEIFSRKSLSRQQIKGLKNNINIRKSQSEQATTTRTES